MGQPNLAQREPSMEEILASIRRIIEDGDAPRRAGEEDGLDLERLRSEVANSSRPEQLRAEATASVEVPLQRPTVEPEPVETWQVSEALEDEVSVELSADEISASPEPQFNSQAHTDMLEREASAAAERVRARSAEIARAMDTEEPEPEPAQPHAIISPTTGRQVAAAFEELSAAFELTRTKSFDEMAEEMLRPMLQEWLDNNLPTLVERLVREEIERVARGGR